MKANYFKIKIFHVVYFFTGLEENLLHFFDPKIVYISCILRCSLAEMQRHLWIVINIDNAHFFSSIQTAL